MHVAGVQTHLFQVRADKEARRQRLLTDNYDFRETWTAADGRSFSLLTNGVFQQIKAKSLGRLVVQFSFHDVGQWS